jgi:hypothetical protein
VAANLDSFSSLFSRRRRRRCHLDLRSIHFADKPRSIADHDSVEDLPVKSSKGNEYLMRLKPIFLHYLKPDLRPQNLNCGRTVVSVFR